jgi:hypothetical protein
MQAGEKWRETLVKANVACEALLFLASPESLASDECRRVVRRAEDDRKGVIVAILRDVTVDDSQLAGYTDRQIMDLSTNPRPRRPGLRGGVGCRDSGPPPAPPPYSYMLQAVEHPQPRRSPAARHGWCRAPFAER